MTGAKYEPFITIQEAINKAVAESRPVRFICNLSGAELKKGIVDLKGCSIMKPDKESNDVAVVPECVTDFDFNEVDTKITLYRVDGGKLC